MIINITTSLGQVVDYSLLKSSMKNASIKDVPYDDLLDREFTRILTGQNTNFGTFATLSTKDATTSISGHIPICDKSNFGVNISGGTTEGIVPLLSGEKVNPDISIGLQFNRGIYDHNDSIRADATQILNFLNTLDSLSITTIRNRDEIKFSKQKKELELNQKVEKIVRLEKYKNTLTSVNNARYNLVIDSIEIQLIVLRNDTSYLVIQLEKLKSQDEIKRQMQNIERSKSDRYLKELQKLNLIGYKLKWVSFFGNLNNRTFNLLDKSLSYDNQINKKTFNRLEFGVSWNTYQLKDQAFKTYYSSYGIAYLLEDNFETLTSVTLNQKEEISSTPTNRSISSTKTLYVGDYEKGLSKIKAFWDLYWFMTYNQSIALHFNPGLRIGFNSKTKLDTTFGFLLGFRNQEKDKNVINVGKNGQIDHPAPV